MQRFAQTITTLYAEAREAGWRLDDLLALRDAHELAVRLFAGQHRPCGKPFTCHLVGTASVLVHAGAPAPVAAAGLLHAAYRFGVFDRGVTGPCVPARRLVRGAVGPDVESLVFGYETLPWDPSSIRALSRMGVPEGSEEVVAMRLANVVEECFDGGMLYSLKWEAKRDLVAGAQGELLGIAHSLRLPRLEQALADALRTVRELRVPADLVADRGECFRPVPLPGRRSTRRARRRLVRPSA
jgi:hypothetical protein